MQVGVDSFQRLSSTAGGDLREGITMLFGRDARLTVVWDGAKACSVDARSQVVMQKLFQAIFADVSQLSVEKIRV